MGMTTHAVRLFPGTPFRCRISQYMRMVIYEVPYYRVSDGHFSSCTVMETDDFKASVVINPVNHVLAETFSDQHIVDLNFEGKLREACEKEESGSESKIFVVFQSKEDLGLFSTLEGQCLKVQDEGQEKSFIYDCIDAPAPDLTDTTASMNIVLTAIRAEFEIAEAMQKVFDNSCYKTDEGQCLYEGGKLSVTAHLTKIGPPITPDSLMDKVEASKLLVTKIGESIERDKIESLRDDADGFGTRLGEMVEALQLDPSLDSAYLRLWYLQLWDRVEKFRFLFARRQRPPELRSCLKSNAYRPDRPKTTVGKQSDPSSARHNSYQLRRFALSFTLFKQALILQPHLWWLW